MDILIYQKTGQISQKIANTVKSAEVKESDVLLNQLGDGITFARSCIIRKDFLPAFVTRSVGVIRVNNEKLNPNFLNAYLVLPKTKNYIESFNSGTTKRAIDGGKMKQFLIPLPPLNEQKIIGMCYVDLLKKISILKLINDKLEKISQTLFKSWFIDFDGHTEFEDSELGQIPKGWKVGKFGDITENFRDSIQPKNITSDSKYIGLDHLPRGSIWLTKWESGEGLLSNKFEFKRNDILFGKLRPYFKKVVVSPIDGICSTDILVIRPKSNEWLAYALSIISSDDFINYTDRASTGTRMPRVNWESMIEYPIVLPTRSLIISFNNFVIDIIRNAETNIKEIQLLKTFRDSLVPKLMSGEIRVKN